MTIKKTIVNIVLAVVMAGVVVLAGMAASRRVADPDCKEITIIIQDSTERQYVTPQELQNVLRGEGLWPMGQPLSKVNCHDIERCIKAHPMIREAECHERSSGEIKISVTQRIPLMRVEGDEQYFVDMERTIMPIRASVNTPMVVVSGRIGKQQALGEMYDFVYRLNKERFWQDKIHTIRVVNPKMIELVDTEHHYVIILGELTDAEARMDSLRKLYEKGFEKIGWPKYKQIDLRFANQIVGRK